MTTPALVAAGTLRRFRRAAGSSRARVAVLFGVTVATVRGWERPTVREDYPSFDQVGKLATLYCVPFGYFWLSGQQAKTAAKRVRRQRGRRGR